MSLIRPPVMQYEATAGTPLAFAKAYFYQVGTTTPVIVWGDPDFDESLGSNVTADSQGLFPAIYARPVDGILRMKLIVQGGDLNNPLLDIAEVNEVTAALTGADVDTALGYVPVNPNNAILLAGVANPQQNFTPTVLNNNDLGFRHNRHGIHDANYTFGLDDSQGSLVHDDTGAVNWTIPPHSAIAFPLGTHIRGFSLNTGVVTLKRGLGVVLRKVGAVTDQDWAMAQWGFFDVEQVQQDVWSITTSSLLT